MTRPAKPHENNNQYPLLPGAADGRDGQNEAVRPIVERPDRPRRVAKAKAQAAHPERILVRVTSVRRRLLDEDNLSAKYVIDCCRYAGLLPTDAPGQVKIEVGQRKPGPGESECTEVEIITPEPDEA